MLALEWMKVKMNLVGCIINITSLCATAIFFLGVAKDCESS